MPPAGQPKFKRRKADRPEEIVAAAMEIFAEKGFAAARLDDIAARAGVSKGALYLYFATKEDLFRAVIEQGVAPNLGRMQAALVEHRGAFPELLRALAEGKSVAYASEAGTPLVADPGYQLGRAAIAAGHPVFAAPGPSAVLAALTVSGLPSDRFLFAGFPPNTASARRKWLREVAQVPATLIFYESPKRVSEMLADCVTEFGEERLAVVCRELTKRFEEVRRGPLRDLAAEFSGQSVKGEIVVLVDRARGRQFGPEDVDAALRDRLGRMSVKDAAAEVAEALGLPRREVYQAALALEKDK